MDWREVGEAALKVRFFGGFFAGQFAGFDSGDNYLNRPFLTKLTK